MNDFNATLMRAFAEEHHEPADDGFSVLVAQAVARSEKRAQWLSITQSVGMAAGAAAVIWGLVTIFGAYQAEIMSSVGLEIARAHGALTQASSTNLSSMAAGLTQILLIIGALAGAGMVYRNSQQQ